MCAYKLALSLLFMKTIDQESNTDVVAGQHNPRVSTVLLLAAGLLFTTCSDDLNDPNSGLTAYELNVIAYFKEIALRFEFGGASQITRKWSDPMRIFVTGT
jgi:hypothetical protein